MSNNNDNIMQALAKMQQDISSTRQMLQELIHILAPVFPSERVALSSSEEMEKALNQGTLIFE
jgi:hypothetical protein